jgi:mutator protein MutT
MVGMQVAVVGAAIVRDGRVLAARRAGPSRLAGGWEFPGGKVEPGEDEPAALIRECVEELGVLIAVGDRLAEVTDGPIRLALYAATLVEGTPQPLHDHDELRWLTAPDLSSVGWLPIDAALVAVVAERLMLHPGAMRFRATLDLNGKTATGFAVPDEIVASLGGGKRPPVRVTIQGYTFRTTVAPMGGRFLIGVNADNRAAAGVQAGDQLDVELELDTAPREVALPDDLTAALADDVKARNFYDTLSYTHRKEWVRWIEEAKKPETRATRVAKAVDALHTGTRTH